MTRRASLLLAVVAAGLVAGCRGGHGGAPPSPAPTGEVAVDRTASDPVTGNEVTVEDVDRSGADLLVQVSVTAGSRFGAPVTPAALTLRTAAGSTVPAAAPPASFPAFSGAEPGLRASGWLAFATPAAPGGSLVLGRAAFTVVGSQQTVPAAAYPVLLPSE